MVREWSNLGKIRLGGEAKIIAYDQIDQLVEEIGRYLKGWTKEYHELAWCGGGGRDLVEKNIEFKGYRNREIEERGYFVALG